MKIVESLLPLLPENYYSAPKVHLGSSVEVDVGTFESDADRQNGFPSSLARPGTSATATWKATEPTFQVETDLPDVDEYEVRVYDFAHGRRLVAAIELVSPSNKDRPESRQAFIAKCATLLQEGVSVTIVDVVTTRDFNLYRELLRFLGKEDPSMESAPTAIYAATCRGVRRGSRYLLENWYQPLLLGSPLPVLPLWLSPTLAISLELEQPYEATCRALRIA